MKIKTKYAQKTVKLNGKGDTYDLASALVNIPKDSLSSPVFRGPLH